jgi:hypothetical protein
VTELDYIACLDAGRGRGASQDVTISADCEQAMNKIMDESDGLELAHGTIITKAFCPFHKLLFSTAEHTTARLRGHNNNRHLQDNYFYSPLKDDDNGGSLSAAIYSSYYYATTAISAMTVNGQEPEDDLAEELLLFDKVALTDDCFNSTVPID